jgi:protein involved in polysaccharide export with SLBB domain
MRALALALCAQPLFWAGSVAQAQTQAQAQVLGSGLVPAGPAEPEVVRAERPALSGPTAGATPMDELLDPDKYVCGPGDVLELNFWGVQNFKLRTTVDMEGRAFITRIGYLSLQGKTLSDARRMMRESIARYFPRLSFDVTLAEPRTFLVQVVDDVARPGSYPSRAIDRVATLIARAGGLGPNASRRRIEIRRAGGAVLRADLLLYTLTGDLKHNPYLLDGDVVRVPFEDLAATIDGAVNRPGRYELVGTRDLAELVELGGGLSPVATRQLPISLVRRLPDDRQDQRLLDYSADGALPALSIEREDGVRIPGVGELQRAVTVVGATAAGGADEASATRRLSFVQGDSVRTLLDRIGGVGPLADLTSAYIIRQGKALPVDLYALVMLRDLKADRPIELGDTLVVPFARRSVTVKGAVFTPGSYPYHPGYRVEEYLSLAGGPNRFAQDLSEVRLIHPNGETKEYAPGLKVVPGSSLVVPERNFSRSEVVQIVLGAASVLISGVAVVLAARK